MNAEKISAENLQRFCVACFSRLGLGREEAELTAGNLIFANLRGVDSHGVIRLKIYCDRLKAGGFRADARPEIISENDSTALIDGGGGVGQVIAMRAIEVACEKAASTG